MSRLSPLFKGGIVGVVLAVPFAGTSVCQTDSSTPSYRLEKIGSIQCDLESIVPAVKMSSAGAMDFKVARNGEVYFILYEKGKICRFDSTGKLIRSVATDASLIRGSSGCAFSPEGDLLVLDGRGKRLLRYDAFLDLIGEYSLNSKEELEPVFGLVVTSRGDFFAAGGQKSNIWKLEPEGRGFSVKPVYLPENYRYSFPFETEGGKLVTTDPLGALVVMDRYGNLLRSFSFWKGLRAASIDENYLVTFWPYTELMVLDTVGVVLAHWKTAELDSVFDRVHDFQGVQDRVYFLLPAKNEILSFRIVHSGSFALPERRR